MQHIIVIFERSRNIWYFAAKTTGGLAEYLAGLPAIGNEFMSVTLQNWILDFFVVLAFVQCLSRPSVLPIKRRFTFFSQTRTCTSWLLSLFEWHLSPLLVPPGITFFHYLPHRFVSIHIPKYQTKLWLLPVTDPRGGSLGQLPLPNVCVAPLNGVSLP